MSEQRFQQLQALLGEDPKDTFLRHAMAMELRRLGRPQEAIATMEELLLEVPDHVGGYYQLATMLAEEGRINDALETCNAGMLRCIVVGDRKAHRELGQLRDQLQEED
jgi:predicted Zn-dependent protease